MKPLSGATSAQCKRLSMPKALVQFLAPNKSPGILDFRARTSSDCDPEPCKALVVAVLSPGPFVTFSLVCEYKETKPCVLVLQESHSLPYSFQAASHSANGTVFHKLHPSEMCLQVNPAEWREGDLPMELFLYYFSILCPPEET